MARSEGEAVPKMTSNTEPLKVEMNPIAIEKETLECSPSEFCADLLDVFFDGESPNPTREIMPIDPENSRSLHEAAPELLPMRAK